MKKFLVVLALISTCAILSAPAFADDSTTNGYDNTSYSQSQSGDDSAATTDDSDSSAYQDDSSSSDDSSSDDSGSDDSVDYN